MCALRVAMLIQYYYPIVGGAERLLAELARTLGGLGVEVQVITRRTNQLASFAHVEGTPVYRVPAPRPRALASLCYTATSLYLLRRLKPDLVHAHGLLSTARTALIVQRLLKLPIVVTVHNLEFDVQRLDRTWLGARQLSALSRSVNAFISVNTQIDQALARLGVPSERRVVIPNGVDPTRFSPATTEERLQLRGEIGMTNGPVALYVGRLVPEKCVDNLLAAWPLVRSAHPQAQLLIVGEGPRGASLRRLAGPGVKFIGQVEDVIPYLKAADIFVLPSAIEGMSVALLEALSTGLAVIATNVGGAIDVVKSGENALLVAPNDVQALAHALTFLLDDAERRSRMGRAGRETVLQRFQIAVSAKELLDLYHRILDNSAAHRQNGIS